MADSVSGVGGQGATVGGADAGGAAGGADFNQMLQQLQENFRKLADVQLRTQNIMTEGKLLTHPSRQQVS